MSKLIEIFIFFTEAEWAAMRSKYSEIEIKTFIHKASDRAISIECEKIEAEKNITTDEESEEEAG